MREIEFRAVREQEPKQFVYGDLIRLTNYKGNEEFYICDDKDLDHLILVDKNTVGQLTTMITPITKDKVYERDILLDKRSQAIGIVRYHNVWNAYYFQKVWGFNDYREFVRMSASDPIWNIKDFKVLGNEQFNPEILKEGKY